MRANTSNRRILDKLRRQTLINSTASSLRLAGINVTNKEVAQIVHESIISSFSKKSPEKTLSPKQLTVWQYLEHGSEAMPGKIAKATKVARPTVSQALAVLMRLKKVERIGQGRSTRYRKL